MHSKEDIKHYSIDPNKSLSWNFFGENCAALHLPLNTEVYMYIVLYAVAP